MILGSQFNSWISRLAAFSLAMAAAVSGCSQRGAVDLLEARLRDQDDELRTLEKRLSQSQAELAASRRTNEELQPATELRGQQVIPAELLEQQFQTSGIRIDSLLTGGTDRDGESGDDVLVVAFAPRNQAGKSVAVTGRVRCELIDPELPPPQQSLGVWEFDANETRAAWQTVLGKPLFRFELPLTHVLTDREIELRVVLQAEPGDRFEASQQIRLSRGTAN